MTVQEKQQLQLLVGKKICILLSSSKKIQRVLREDYEGFYIQFEKERVAVCPERNDLGEIIPGFFKGLHLKDAANLKERQEIKEQQQINEQPVAENNDSINKEETSTKVQHKVVAIDKFLAVKKDRLKKSEHYRPSKKVVSGARPP